MRFIYQNKFFFQTSEEIFSAVLWDQNIIIITNDDIHAKCYISINSWGQKNIMLSGIFFDIMSFFICNWTGNNIPYSIINSIKAGLPHKPFSWGLRFIEGKSISYLYESALPESVSLPFRLIRLPHPRSCLASNCFRRQIKYLVDQSFTPHCLPQMEIRSKLSFLSPLALALLALFYGFIDRKLQILSAPFTICFMAERVYGLHRNITLTLSFIIHFQPHLKYFFAKSKKRIFNLFIANEFSNDIDSPHFQRAYVQRTSTCTQIFSCMARL